MAKITNEARTELIALVVGMFDGAPGRHVLDDLIEAHEAGMSLQDIAEVLTTSDEYKTLYGGTTTEEFVEKMVDSLVGDLVSAEDRQWAIDEFVTEMNAGATEAQVFVAAITALRSTGEDDESWSDARVALENKIEVATYHSVELRADSTTLAQLQQVLADVDNTQASVDAAKADLSGAANGETFTLTAGIDQFEGGSANDVFNATENAAGRVFGALDVLDGGAGKDTLNVDSTVAGAFADFGGATIRNIETINVATNDTFNGLDVSGIVGLETFNGSAAGTGANTVTAGNSNDVNLTLATTSNTTVNGGRNVSVEKGAAAGTITITGSALASASVTGGTGAVTIENTGAAANSLKSVSLAGTAGAANITGKGIETLDVSGANNRTVTVNNATANNTLTVNAEGTVSAAAPNVSTTLASANTKTLNLNVSGSNNITLGTVGSLTDLAIGGSGTLTLQGAAAAAELKSIDGSEATGNLTLGLLNAATVNVTTGSGNDTFTLSATTKVNVDTGAGNDTVTVGSHIADGSTINLGAGNDKLLAGTGGQVLRGKNTVIDGGEGFNTVAASLINAANASQFKNFSALDLTHTGGTFNLDVELMTGSEIEGLTLNGGGTGNATVSNVAAGVGLTVEGASSGTTTINTQGDDFAITFGGSAAANAGIIALAGVEEISIVSGGSPVSLQTGNPLTNILALNAAQAQTIEIVGARNLNLGLADVGTDGATGLSLVDASEATGDLTLTTVDAGVSDKGFTILSGSGDDTITLAQAATVDAGAGDDTIVSSADGGTFTGGAGDDTFNVASAIVGTASTAEEAIKVVITDFTAGDELVFGTAGSTVTEVELNESVQNLTEAIELATDGVTNEVTWFHYGANTYVVANDGTVDVSAGDVVVQLEGLIDLTDATLDSGLFAM